MLTKNFYAILAGLLRRREGKQYTVSVTDCQGNIQTTDSFFTDAVPYTLFGAISNGASWADGSKHGIWRGTFFGTGTTPATVDDIVLESPITRTDITHASPGTPGLCVELNADHMLISATHKVTNKSGQDIAITELGAYGNMFTSTDVPFMLDHTVLQDPIVIPAGQTVPIDYEIRFPYGK